MITRRSQSALSTAKFFLLIPDASPLLSPALGDCNVNKDNDMSDENLSLARPISINSPPRETVPSPTFPTLDDILNERSRPPFTLSAFTAFLSQQHCLETLEFTLDAKRYQVKHGQAMARSSGVTQAQDNSDVHQLQQDWTRLIDVYVRPGSPREINLPAEERDDLLNHEKSLLPPEPGALEPAVQRINDLMAESIFLPFLNSFAPEARAKTFSGPESIYGDRAVGLPHLSTSLYGNYDARPERSDQNVVQRRPSPPSSASVDLTAVKPFPPLARPYQSCITSGIRPAAASGEANHVSHAPAVSGSECGVADDSGSATSPSTGDPMTPPTTPPSSEVPINAASRRQSPNPNRNEPGGWRKMGIKIWGRKKHP